MQAPRDGNVLLGVRPEHLALDDDAAFRGEMSLVEPTGADTFVVLKTGVGDMTVRVSAQSRVRAGDAVGLQVATDHVNWFDVASGVRV
jgi:multiple sugar transport system ATP-binding protein